MHPSKDANVVRLPHVMRSYALQSVSAIHTVVAALYA